MQLTPSGNPRILLLHGPNLNLLGQREPSIYGTMTFEDLNKNIKEHARSLGLEVKIVQSNHEGALIDAIHDAASWADAIILNAGAYTHYAYGIADAIKAVRLPAIEVHLSNIHARTEQWRHTSVIAPVVVGQILGFGPRSYFLALDAVKTLLAEAHS